MLEREKSNRVRVVRGRVGVSLCRLSPHPTRSVSFILEVYVFCDLLSTCLCQFVVTAAGHVRKHFLVSVGEGHRECRLLRRALDLCPLSACDGLGHIVRSWTRSVHLRDHPGLSAFGSSNFSEAHAKGPRLCQLVVGVVVLGGGHKRGDPLFVICEVDAIVLAKQQDYASSAMCSEIFYKSETATYYV